MLLNPLRKSGTPWGTPSKKFMLCPRLSSTKFLIWSYKGQQPRNYSHQYPIQCKGNAADEYPLGLEA
jgi:hypothetical protein